MPPVFLDIVVAFALFCRSAINLPSIVTLFHNTIFIPFLSFASTVSPLHSYRRPKSLSVEFLGREIELW